MAFANRVSCYVCEQNFIRRLTIPLSREGNVDLFQIAIYRREAAGNPQIDIFDDTRVCFNCHNALINDFNQMENNPNCQ